MTHLFLLILMPGVQIDDLNQSPSSSLSSLRESDLTAYHNQARGAVEGVLSLPEFDNLRSDMEGWWLAMWERLLNMLKGIARAFNGLPGWLWWGVVIWLILTLVAILCHFIYVLAGIIGSSAARRTAAATGKVGRGELLGIRELDFDSVYQRAREHLTAANWSEATKYLYVAAILWLDRQGWIGFKSSKTNHDYLAELARQPEHRAKFRQLTNRFESTVYGGEPCTAGNCQEMASLVEVVLREATPVVAL